MPHTAYIGIGSNLSSPRDRCLEAMDRIAAHAEIRVTARSSLYETEPLGVAEQDWFVNAVVEAQTPLPPESLLKALLEIEQAMGRTRGEKWGPRIIDLDLLFFENLTLKNDSLEVPHPELENRRFVLLPLSEIAGATVHPRSNKTVDRLLAELTDPSIVRPLPPAP